MQTLTTLLLQYNEIGSIGAQHFADALAYNTVIFHFILSLSFSYVNVFAKTLTTLDVVCNKIGPSGGKHIAEALRKNTVSLKAIYFISLF